MATDLTPSTDIQNFLAASNKALGVYTLGINNIIQLPNGVFASTIANMGNIFTDENASNPVQLQLPPLADALITGGTIKVNSSREYNFDGNYISVYPNSADNGFIFLIGTHDVNNSPLYSLYSTGIGDYLELMAVTINNNNYWQVLNFSGLWQDRD